MARQAAGGKTFRPVHPRLRNRFQNCHDGIKSWFMPFRVAPDLRHRPLVPPIADRREICMGDVLQAVEAAASVCGTIGMLQQFTRSRPITGKHTILIQFGARCLSAGEYCPDSMEICMELHPGAALYFKTTAASFSTGSAGAARNAFCTHFRAAATV